MTIFTVRTCLCVSGILSAAVLAAVPASAQVATDSAAPTGQQVSPADQDIGLQDIIVTAQRRAERLQSVPVSVSAFNGNSLRNANIGNVQALQGSVPSLTIDRSGFGLGIPQISLRGISLQDVEKSVESGIGVTLDGVPLGFSSGMLLDAFDVERIEVLRGPQGLLFGKNTTGGTINVIRTRPDPDSSAKGRVRFTLGSFGRNDYEGVISAPIIPGKLAAKFAGTVQKNSGEFRNTVFGGRSGDRDFRDFTLTLNATPNDRLSMLLTLERLEDDSEVPPYVPLDTAAVIPLGVPGYFGGGNLPCFNPATAATCVPIDKDRNTVENAPIAEPSFFNLDAVTLETAYAADALRFVNIFGYRASEERIVQATDATRYSLFYVRKPQKTWQFSDELRAESSFDGPFNFVTGAFFFKSKYSARQQVSLDFAALDITLAPGQSYLNSLNNFDISIRSRSIAIFFQGDFAITPELKLIAGARQTWDRKSIDYTQYLPVGGTTRDLSVYGSALGRAQRSASFNKLTPKIGLEFKPQPNVLLYGSFSRGYNAGGFNGRPPSPALVIPFQPESLDAYEIGLKSDFFNNRLRFNVAGYYNTMKNKQEDLLIISGTSNGTRTINAAKARYKGVEIELGLVPVRGWTISSTLGYLDAHYVSFTGNLGQGEADLSGLSLRRTPKWTGGVMSDYVFPAGDGEIGLNARFSYTSKFETNVLNDPRGTAAAVGLLDLSVRYKLPPISGATLQLSGFVKNVTDRTTYSGMSSGNSVGTFIEFAIPRVGRTWGASLTAEF